MVACKNRFKYNVSFMVVTVMTRKYISLRETGKTGQNSTKRAEIRLKYNVSSNMGIAQNMYRETSKL